MIKILALVLTALVSLEHVYILVLEMFLWTKPRGLKVFGKTLEYAESTKALAANQGLYNGFLAAGLAWGLLAPNPEFAFQIRVFFLNCVLVAGLYGSVTALRRILVVQVFPAALALGAVLVAGA